MSEVPIQSGRPRLLVDFGLILDLRERAKLGWSRIAQEYTRKTGQYISKQTCKRRYKEVTYRRSFTDTSEKILTSSRSPPDPMDPTPTILPNC